MKVTLVALCLLLGVIYQPAPTALESPLELKFVMTPYELQALAEWEAPDLAPYLDRNLQQRIARIAAMDAPADTARQLNAFADGGPTCFEPGRYGGIRHLIPRDEWGDTYELWYQAHVLDLMPDLPDGSPGTPLRAWVDAWFAPDGGFYDE
jgi:hypothetical protein